MKYTNEQMAVIESDKREILCVAGPGSGKTSTLIGRLAFLIAYAPQTVIITFTNAGAKEIKERCDGMGAKFGYLGTLHGFCLKLINEFGSWIGYGGKLSVLDEEQAAELLEDEAAKLRFKGSMKELLEIKKAGPRYLTGSNRYTAAEVVVNTYFNRLRRNGTLDFDMLLFEAHRLIFAYRDKLLEMTGWGLLFVDEFQDSGDMDFKIYKDLPIFNKFFVGDPDQSIYGFRGGNVRNILEVGETAYVFKLTKNFRCPDIVCKIADKLIYHNSERIEKKTFSALGIVPGAKIETVLMPSDKKEAAWIMGHIESLIEEGTPADEIAVLCRTNHLAATLAAVAEARGIDVKKKPESKFPRDWSRARLTLELLINPLNDMIAEFWIRELHGKNDAANARHHAAVKQVPIMEHYKVKGVKVTAATVENYAQWLARLEISRESIEFIQAKEAEIANPSLLDIVFALARDSENRHELGAGVTFTTIHSSKGREWEAVFIPAIEQENMPGTRKDLNIEEERRILFVGITRAKRALYLSHAQTRSPAFGSPKPLPASPSQFWREMGL